MQKVTVTVPNISCGHCVHTIQEELKELSGVQQVNASKDTKQVEVVFEAPTTWAEIEAKLIEINYAPAAPNVSIN
ncbi:MAG: heavy-metal-associated domain-containing protein [Anaerolinea sp.]|nr:heavy-metal-associated domain-containing protein [Anaerolinea sp.]MCC6974906.1 heavy-metal-associated domain-containing protein [Anaerolineae bacterium]